MPGNRDVAVQENLREVRLVIICPTEYSTVLLCADGDNTAKEQGLKLRRRQQFDRELLGEACGY